MRLNKKSYIHIMRATSRSSANKIEIKNPDTSPILLAKKMMIQKSRNFFAL